MLLNPDTQKSLCRCVVCANTKWHDGTLARTDQGQCPDPAVDSRFLGLWPGHV